MNRYSSNNGSIIERSGTGVQAYMAQVYGWMSCGLLLTAFVAWLSVNNDAMLHLLFNYDGQYLTLSTITYVLCVVELGLVFVLSGMIDRMSGAVATSIFMLYSALNGMTLSSVLLIYTHTSIMSTFFITAGMFAAMSIYGYTTKRDLTGIGGFLIMALIGILIASLVNIWMKSSAVMWAITYIGVFIFIGLTAYDTQKLKAIGQQLSADDTDNFRKYTIIGALTLYLDFINLFLLLLRVIGNRR